MNDDFDYQGCEWDGTNWKNCEECGAFNEIMNDCCTECCFEFYPECPKCKGAANTPDECDCIPF